MKYVVTALPFTGGPQLSKAVSLLLERPVIGQLFDHSFGQRVSTRTEKSLFQIQDITYTTSLTALDLLQTKDIQIFSTRRDFIPYLCSRILAEKHLNVTELFHSAVEYRSILSTLGPVDDAAFLNLAITAHPKLVLDEARKWRRACVVVLDEKIVQVKYEDLLKVPELVAQRLGSKLSVEDMDLVEIVEQLEDQLDYAVYDRLLDESSRNILRSVIQQVSKEKVL